MTARQFILPLAHELIVDLFAGGGGASCGIEQALGRHVDIAVNHDPEAVSLHQANHPQTQHFVSDVFEVDPVAVCDGRPVGLLWASPDCKHFSKAKGGKPVSKKIRGLAWVVVKWAKLARPRMIHLENVEEFQTWGPLLPNGRVCPDRKGRTFRTWKRALERLGYVVEHRELRACDYGAPTTRKRLFLTARRDGLPIVWPEPTHAKAPTRGSGLLPWRTAAECIDWSLPCPSIFTRARPLAENTMRRIARGVMKYVVGAAEPFIVPVTHPSDARVQPITEPLRTITSAQRGEFAMAVPTLIQTGYGERPGQAPRVPGLDKPLGTAVDGQKHALVTAFLAKHYGGNETPGTPLHRPVDTITTQDHHHLVCASMVALANGDHAERPGTRASAVDEPVRTIHAGGGNHALLTAHLAKFRGESPGTAADAPVDTITAGSHNGRPAGAGHGMGLVASSLVKLRGTSTAASTDEPLATVSAQGTHHAEVRALLTKFYGQGGQDQDLREPLHTVPTRDRFALVTVAGELYAIADIGMRMLEPRELYRAQGFPESYVIDRGADGRVLPKHAQVRMCGNSVCPPLARAIVAANYIERDALREAA
jgi:DNA (cytosine-5)-methyltransferase 1